MVKLKLLFLPEFKRPSRKFSSFFNFEILQILKFSSDKKFVKLMGHASASLEFLQTFTVVFYRREYKCTYRF